MECVTHTGEKVFMVCKSCDNYPFVCGVCLEEEHAEHKVQTLRNAAQAIRQNLEQVETENIRVLKEIQSDLDDLTKVREDLQQESNCVDEEISKRADILRSKLDDVNTEVKQEHRLELGKNSQVIDRTEEALKQQVSKIDTFKMKVAQLQKMNDYVEVIKVGREVEVPDTSRIPRPDIQALTFIPGTVRDGELNQMFGGINVFDSSKQDAISTVCDDSTPEKDDKSSISSDFDGSIERESKITVTSEISFKLFKNDGIRYMCCPEAGVCWLKCRDENSVKLTNRSGVIKQAINLETKTKGFTVTSDNRLLFCCTSQECVKEIKLPNGEITEKFSTSPLKPNCICTGPSGDIYVTLVDEYKYDLDNDSSRVLVKYNSRGREKARCSELLFVLPEEVCVNSTGSRVAVINLTSRYRRELVVLDQDLSPLFVYTGPSVLTGKSLLGFSLTGATFDARNNIVVAETFSKTVQLLSPSCEPLQVLVTMKTYPWSLSLLGDEVWVGDNDGGVQIFRYSY